MKAHIVMFLILGGLNTGWNQVHADQQTIKDEGVTFGQNNLGSTQNLSTTLPVTEVPGYTGTNLPQTNYYNNQDLSGMQTDAVVDLTGGTASEPAQFAYEQSLVPKLQFSATDPILLNSDTYGDAAVQNPDLLTVPTGDCAVTDVAVQDTRIEHCTAWMVPTTHTCNKTLDVNVTWNDVSNCPLGTGFNQVSALHNAAGRDDYVYGRAYCNPGVGDGLAALQVNATDGDPADCTSWTNVTISTDQVSDIYLTRLRPRFRDSCTNVYVTGQGSCVAGNCNYRLNYYEMGYWVRNDGNDPRCGTGGTSSIPALLAAGVTDGLNPYVSGPHNVYCLRKSSSLQLSFEEPSLTRTPSVTETWNDGCGYLEAQVQ